MLLQRGLKFSLVGAIGVGVQFAAFWLYSHWMSYRWATPLSVETAVLHNFLWHERFTWKDRPAFARQRWMRLVRFHLANGLIPIFGNWGIMLLLVGDFHVPRYIAMAVAISVCFPLNFVLGEWFVFRK